MKTSWLTLQVTGYVMGEIWPGVEPWSMEHHENMPQPHGREQDSLQHRISAQSPDTENTSGMCVRV
jgi:hypothetical protein